MQHIALVFDVFDDGDQDSRIALPQKDAIDVGPRHARKKSLDLAIVVSENDDRDIESGLFYIPRQLCGVHVTNCEVRDDEIKVPGAGHGRCLCAGRYMSDSRNLLQTEV